MSRIVVVGKNHHNTLGVVRSCGIRGLNPDVILCGQSRFRFVEKSKYAGNIIYSNYSDIAGILSSYSDEEVIVLTTSDQTAVAVDCIFKDLPSNIKIPNAQGNLSNLINKHAMCRLAEATGLNVPRYVEVNINDLPSDIPYPCITKAISSIAGKKEDTIVCENESELLRFINGGGVCSELLIEEFIEKEFEFQLIGLSLNAGEEIIIPGHSHIHNPGIQNSYYLTYCQNDDTFTDTIDRTKEFIKKTQYSGLFSVEFIRTKDEKDYFLEMNFRNDGNAYCVTDAGYNLPYIWYLYHTGGDYRAEISRSEFKQVDFCPEDDFLQYAKSGQLSPQQWTNVFNKCNSFAVYNKDDIDPYNELIRYIL